jgi:hypothetical protein
MRSNFLVIACAACLFLGCSKGTLSDFWKGVPLLEEDISVSEDRFADFAELAVAAPEKEAKAALDVLFDRLLSDEVAYYVYSEWMNGAFYSVFSPCRNAGLYSYSVGRMEKDGFFNEDELRPYQMRSKWININTRGDDAVVPGVSLNGERTLVLVMDMSCPSCLKAIENLSQDEEWEGVRKIAIGLGYGQVSPSEGWEIYTPDDANNIYDIRLSPVYYVVSPEGKVELSYTAAI